jgi:dCTP deaminase
VSLLSYNELVKLVEDGVITNVRDGAINASSIDIHLAPKILVEANRRKTVTYAKREPLGMYEIDLNAKGGFDIPPGGFLLASSVEMFNLPADISAQYRLKSSMARIGLEHLNAGHCDAGWHGSALTLELKNITQFHTIRLTAGDPIGQMVFWRHEEVPAERSYAARGRYNHNETVSGIRE